MIAQALAQLDDFAAVLKVFGSIPVFRSKPCEA